MWEQVDRHDTGEGAGRYNIGVGADRHDIGVGAGRYNIGVGADRHDIGVGAGKYNIGVGADGVLVCLRPVNSMGSIQDENR